jgi:endoglucanase
MNRAEHGPSTGGARFCTLVGAIGLFLVSSYSQAYGAPAPGITVVGNQTVTTSAGTLGTQSVGANVAVVLRGINFSGSEYACDSQSSFFDDPPGNQATINGMLAWHANVIRLPLNEDCWIGTKSGLNGAYSGTNYQTAMKNFVTLANASGLIVEVDLHCGSGTSSLGICDSYPGLDVTYAPAFWTSVANTFKNNASVIFNLINEPYITSWPCYRDGGCTTPTVKKVGTWTVVGTQSIVNSIRATGAANPIIVAGLDYSNQLNNWLTYMPMDPQGKIIAGVHVYFDGLDCENAACWSSVFTPIQAAGHPVIVDEMGFQGSCTSAKITTLMNWADAQTPEIGYWAWSWNPFGCTSGPSLIKNDSFTPTSTYGSGFETHLQSVQ